MVELEYNQDKHDNIRTKIIIRYLKQLREEEQNTEKKYNCFGTSTKGLTVGYALQYIEEQVLGIKEESIVEIPPYGKNNECFKKLTPE